MEWQMPMNLQVFFQALVPVMSKLMMWQKQSCCQVLLQALLVQVME
jgi:hypothetical protein